MTLRALSLAADGGQRLLHRLDALAANLLNADTSGYKRTTMIDPQTPATVMDAGPIRTTRRDLDIAIDGEGFLRLQMPDGSVGFTRAGVLQRDARGTLTGPEGLPLDPPIFVPPSVTQLLINPLGHVQGFDPATPGSLIPLGHLELTRFDNPAGLQSVSGAIFRATPESGDRLDGRPGEVGGFLRQGFLEQSNVNPACELTDLLQVRRAFELNARAIQVADEVLQSVNHLWRKA